MALGNLKAAWLQTFVQVARDGKRTAAAHERGRVSSTMTKHIQSLERWAGTILVEPNSSPAKFTPYGDEFLPKAQAILEAIEDARRFETQALTPSVVSVPASQLRVPPSVPKSDKG